ncbi:hypothetical protein ADINL_2351 [Nitrincola lacisaponensis]|uniref:PEP-CTERM protein-sorting domain-containing protein n=1 Tax=Nitrincola lacisaponensis TaxID=267850 RepID=A0A063Y3W0_9GAMM|nr:hypothetical protein [Nitrincola lacisaponensis]KDE39222.1 hypothetical protein ADINL_2351 [Nitrincola lacisaponensis]
MKRLMTGIVLLLASTLASAATVTISNPVAVTGFEGDQSSVPVSSFFTTDTSVTASFLDGMNAYQPFRIELDVITSVTGALSFDLATSVDEWAVSIVNTATNVVTELGSWFVLNQAGQLTGLLAEVEADTVYKLVVYGDYLHDMDFSRDFTLTLSNIALSEVPLPAAVWLFGSVLLGGLALRRKRQKSLSAQVA